MHRFLKSAEDSVAGKHLATSDLPWMTPAHMSYCTEVSKDIWTAEVRLSTYALAKCPRPAVEVGHWGADCAYVPNPQKP